MVPVEIKTVFRIREAILDIVNPHRDFYPQAYQLDQVLHQCGVLMLEWQKKRPDGSLLPVPYLILDHLRAAPQSIFKLNLDSQRLNDWADRILENLAQPKLQQYPEVLTAMDHLHDLLGTYASVRCAEEKKKKELAEVAKLERLAKSTEKGAQGSLL